MKKTLLLILFSALILNTMCVRLKRSIGKSNELLVVASELEPDLVVEAIQLYNYVPQKEGIFSFIFVSDTALDAYQYYHAILLCGTLEDEFVRTLLNREARMQIEKDTFSLFRKSDIWASGQLTMILAVRDASHIETALAKYGRLIAQTLENHYYQRVKQNYYAGGISSKMKDRLRRHGITLDINEAWLIDTTHQDENFIYVHTHFPDRSIFFYKEATGRPVDGERALAKRDSLARRYYAGDYILKELTIVEPIEFAGLKGIRLKGVWQNDSLVAGGPFLSYFLSDTSTDTLYVIDGMVFNPGERKSDQLTKIEVIMNSLNLIRY
ncbi:DUF4837 family protein [candidate division WOR-3 bacterium]|nr:DUF4837 family protein [candidate division WOR-3 bacterium]